MTHTKTDKKHQKKLQKWANYLEKNPKIVAYFQSQNMDLEDSYEQFEVVKANVSLSDKYKKGQKRTMIGASIVSFAFSAALMSSVSIPGLLILGGLITTMCFVKLKELEFSLIQAAPYSYLKHFSDEFNANEEQAKEQGIENPFPARRLVDKAGQPLKIKL